MRVNDTNSSVASPACASGSVVLCAAYPCQNSSAVALNAVVSGGTVAISVSDASGSVGVPGTYIAVIAARVTRGLAVAVPGRLSDTAVVFPAASVTLLQNVRNAIDSRCVWHGSAKWSVELGPSVLAPARAQPV